MPVWFKPSVPEPYSYRDLLTYSTTQWEGGYQAWTADKGNYLDGELIGTNRGITPAALKDWTGKRPTVADMKALTVEQAVDIMLPRYYDDPNLDEMPWVRPMGPILDMALNAGPRAAVKVLQRAINSGPWTGSAPSLLVDGWLGPVTAEALAEWSKFTTWKQLQSIMNERESFYRKIVAVRPANGAFLTGWLNRARDFGPEGRWIKTLPKNFPFA